MYTVADPGFPRRGAPTPEIGAKTLLFGNIFCRIQHENKKIWPQGAHPWHTFGTANVLCIFSAATLR